MSNGYAMAALVGRKEIMAAVHDTFISSSYWTEKAPPPHD
jgi:glutamate-1-semialdehyde 2,1-aminomutase